jgi:hypothetical protein
VDVSAEAESFVRLVDRLEDGAEGYLALGDVEREYGGSTEAFVGEAILLVDYRTRADGTAVTLCRLNRRHPLVARLTGW